MPTQRLRILPFFRMRQARVGAPSTPGAGQGKTALLVDDSNRLRMMMADFLKSPGTEVLEAQGAVESTSVPQVSEGSHVEVPMVRFCGCWSLGRCRWERLRH